MAIVGVVISFYYYLGVVRAIYWSEGAPSLPRLQLSDATRWALCVCIVGMLYLGLYPNPMVNASNRAAAYLNFAPGRRSTRAIRAGSRGADRGRKTSAIGVEKMGVLASPNGA